MKRLLLLLTFVLITIPSARGQSALEEDLFIEQAELQAMQPRTDVAVEGELSGRPHLLTSRILLGLVPESNAALVSQRGEYNHASVDQYGTRNLAVMQQMGTGNNSALEQIGDNNTILAAVEGNYNYLTISQRGEGNRYELDFQGNNLDHTVTQHGDGLTATQTGMARRPFSIEQQGRGASISVRHNQ